ncbi:MAG: ATP-binding cassette domain-containing protein [Clostridiales bacterium]|nr:ATP-binding cassette domain-containing protein [Clostridiales bacterium]
MLEIKNLEFKVDRPGEQIEIIDRLNLKIETSKLTVITGPNGSGKSTLAKLIMGIEKPTAGKIIFDGVDITDMPVNERAKLKIGYAFQTPPRFKGLTVRKLLSLAHGSELPKDECSSYLTHVGLCSADYLNREVDSSLSGGELKRIEIATLMARELKLAIYDEPEAGIDLWSFARLIESFRLINEDKKNSIIIISHQERIMQLADEIIILANGKVAERGTKDEIFPALIKRLANENSCSFRKDGAQNV